jgi:hypothetical protein
MAQKKDSNMPLLNLGLLKGDEAGCAETLGDTELAEVGLEGPVDDSDEGLKDGLYLELGLLQGDEEEYVETLGGADSELEGRVEWFIRGTARRPTSQTRLARRRRRGLCRNTMGR